MGGIEDYINLLEAVSNKEVPPYDAIRQLSLELDSDEPLEVQSVRATREFRKMLTALAKKYYSGEKRGIYRVLVEAILYFIACREASDEELLQIRRAILSQCMPPREASGEFPPAVSLQLPSRRRVAKIFKEVVLALSEISSYSGVSESLGTVYGVLMADPVYLPVLLSVIRRVAGADERTLVRWVRELYEWGFVEYYMRTGRGELIRLEEVVRIVREIAFKLAEAEYRFTDPERAREGAFKKALLRHLGISLNRPAIRSILNAVSQESSLQSIDLVDETIRNVLFKVMVKSPSYFRFRLFKDVIRNASRRSKPFAILTSPDRSVLVEGYYVKDFVVSREEGVIVRAFIFRAVNEKGEEVPIFDNGLSTRLFVVYGDEVSATHLLHTVVIQELKKLGLRVEKLQWLSDYPQSSPSTQGEAGSIVTGEVSGGGV